MHQNPYYGVEDDVDPDYADPEASVVQTVENPYYGGEPDFGQETPGPRKPKKGNFEKVTVTENVYYDM